KHYNISQEFKTNSELHKKQKIVTDLADLPNKYANHPKELKESKKPKQLLGSFKFYNTFRLWQQKIKTYLNTIKTLSQIRKIFGLGLLFQNGMTTLPETFTKVLWKPF